uniref:Type II secretory pathway, component PulD n=1 Tax=uncultured nuHF2 cluster bacterium HF0500_31B05 TaxID=723589 RepID=E7C5W1_9BACT|nr:type II secretory pathway, component PulD [uncultured nuHF2 cluster bacterium HF0500_31B05]
MRNRRPAYFLLFLALLAAPFPLLATVDFVASPLSSRSKNIRMFQAADTRVMLPLGYDRDPSAVASMELRPGTIEARVYTKPNPDGGVSSVELALVQGLTAGYEFAVISIDDGSATDGLDEIYKGLKRLLKAGRKAPRGKPELGYEMVRLGNIEADRALALLKALGYSTVEFSSNSKTREKVFDIKGDKFAELPRVVKVINDSKTSLLEADRSGSARKQTTSKSKGVQGAPKLGGSHLHSTTTGSPQERLLIIFDKNEPEALEKLINVLHTQIDVPAQQIFIEALVIEVNTNRLRDIGVELTGSKNHVQGSFERSEGNPLTTLLFSRESFTDFLSLKGKLEALVEIGDAEILSSPSVLVLNDRQARVQVGRQIPIVRSTTPTAGTTVKGIEYFPIGIVLNLRPRINLDQSQVTIQIETIISSISTESATKLEDGVSEDISFAPIVDNRLVETYVRVADGTPFIIGGLLSTERLESKVGVPFLSAVPFLGHLFSRKRVENTQREVIVVITPHIVPLETRNFSYLIPKDSDLFDRFDTRLFRNAYRVRDDDIWDLKFIRQSPALQSLLTHVRKSARDNVMLQRTEPFKGLLAGEIPGEAVLVRRMLRDIVQKLEFGQVIETEKVFFFESSNIAGAGVDLVDRGLDEVVAPVLEVPERAVLLTFDAQNEVQPGRFFSYPSAVVQDTVVPTDETEFVAFLRQMNPVDDQGRPLRWTIVLANSSDVAQLQRVMVLKRLLELNGNLRLSLQSFPRRAADFVSHTCGHAQTVPSYRRRSSAAFLRDLAQPVLPCLRTYIQQHRRVRRTLHEIFETMKGALKEF